jgi:sigma-E factor negative regulatory protein RseC
LIEEQGQVVALEGEYAWVETMQSSSCGQCAARKGCGTAALSSIFNRGTSKIKVLNQIRAGAGEQVVLGLRENALLHGAFVAYFIPIVSMLIAAGMVQWLWQPASELAEIGAGFIGLAAGLLWLRRFSARIATDARYQPVILRRVVFPVSDCHNQT